MAVLQDLSTLHESWNTMGDNQSQNLDPQSVNETLPEIETMEGVEAILLSIVLGSINIMTFSGNIFVLISIIMTNRKPHLRQGPGTKLRRTNVFIVNLALTDLALSLMILPPSVIQTITGKWLLGNTLCKVKRNINYM